MEPFRVSVLDTIQNGGPFSVADFSESRSAYLSTNLDFTLLIYTLTVCNSPHGGKSVQYPKHISEEQFRAEHGQFFDFVSGATENQFLCFFLLLHTVEWEEIRRTSWSNIYSKICVYKHTIIIHISHFFSTGLISVSTNNRRKPWTIKPHHRGLYHGSETNETSPLAIQVLCWRKAGSNPRIYGVNHCSWNAPNMQQQHVPKRSNRSNMRLLLR